MVENKRSIEEFFSFTTTIHKEKNQEQRLEKKKEI